MQENSLIKQNILKYLEFKGVTPYRFYKENDVTRGILTQNNGITEENLLKFIKFAQDISLEWLLLGEGNMLKTEKLPITTEIQSETRSNDLITPLLDRIEAQARKIERLEIELAQYRTVASDG